MYTESQIQTQLFAPLTLIKNIKQLLFIFKNNYMYVALDFDSYNITIYVHNYSPSTMCIQYIASPCDISPILYSLTNRFFK